MSKHKKIKLRKGGRPRKAGPREPNGRLSRKVSHAHARDLANAKDAQSVVVMARMRIHGLSEADASRNEAGRPNAGTLHGVMCLRGEITRDQWDAAEWYIGKRVAWLRAIEAAEQHTGTTGGGEVDEGRYADWCAKARETWAIVQSCIQQAMVDQRAPLAAALDVILNRETHVPELVGDLRLALNAIHRRFLQAAQKAA